MEGVEGELWLPSVKTYEFHVARFSREAPVTYPGGSRDSLYEYKHHHPGPRVGKGL